MNGYEAYKAKCSKLYPVVVTFKVTFPEDATCEGLVLEDSLRHVDRAHAERWVKAVRGRVVSGGRRYNDFVVYDPSN